LTSGYYSGEPDAVKPNGGKCNHGGGGTFPPLDGINKDTTDCDWSPHAPLHMMAAAAAQIATEAIFNDLHDHLPPAQFKLLLALDPTVIIGIDTTRDFQLIGGPGAQELIHAIVNDEVMTGHDAAQYVLVGFDDSGVQSVNTTTDADEAMQLGAALTATTDVDSCFGTYSLDAISAAIGASGGGAELLLWTNTAPADADLLDSVIGLAIEKQVRVWTFLWDYSGVLTCTDPPDNSIFQQLATATGGQAFYPTMDDAMTDADAVLQAFDFQGGDVAGGDGMLGPGLAASSLVPIDTSVDSLTVSASGATALRLLRPDGTAVMASDSGVTLRSTGTLQTATVTAPVPGKWTLNLSGTGSYSFRASVSSALSVDSVSFVEERGIPGRASFFPIAGDPIAGQAGTLVVLLGAALMRPSIELRDGSGALLTSSTPIVGEDGAGTELTGMLTVPSVPFSVDVVGSDNAGNPVQRVAPGLVIPRTLQVSPPPIYEVAPGQTTALAFTVTNYGSPGAFAVSPTDDRHYISSVNPASLSLGVGESKIVTVSLSPPANASLGQSDEVLVTVIGATTNDVNRAVVDLSIGEPPKPAQSGGGCSLAPGEARWWWWCVAAVVATALWSRRRRSRTS
jgi:hypothetical protein